MVVPQSDDFHWIFVHSKIYPNAIYSFVNMTRILLERSFLYCTVLFSASLCLAERILYTGWPVLYVFMQLRDNPLWSSKPAEPRWSSISRKQNYSERFVKQSEMVWLIGLVRSLPTGWLAIADHNFPTVVYSIFITFVLGFLLWEADWRLTLSLNSLIWFCFPHGRIGVVAMLIC